MAYHRIPRMGRALLLVLVLPVSALIVTACSSPPTSVETTPPKSGSTVETPTPEPPKYTSSAEIQPLTIDQVFGKEPLPGYNLDPTKIRVLVATGDIIPARMTNMRMVQKNNFKYPFEKTVDLVKSGDLSVINLESPLVKGCQPTMEGMSFCGDQRFIDGLTYAGVSIANLANNHSGNDGGDGLQQTVQLLNANGIDIVGTGNSLIKDVKGLRFGFLAYNGIGPKFDRDQIKADIAALRPQVDVLVVATHWGKEYVAVPDATPGIADDNPREIGHFIIDAGADLIIGNHPHWVQGVEVYKDKLITYAHGNFIFDQEWSQETKEGVVGRYTFYDDKLLKVEFTPVVIEDYAQPNIALGDEAKTILDRMENASREMAKQISAADSQPSAGQSGD